MATTKNATHGTGATVSVTDRIVAALFLVYFAPLMLAVAFVVKYDSAGPVFSKRRHSMPDGKPVVFWEFRTLISERAKRGVASLVTGQYTPLGSFLSNTRLELLPRLFNALRGEVPVSALLR